ncbi:MAG: hypothetical protein MI806_15055 [Minwuiales bacterium]|nr:hypothetical protein [Minwuiales bacterium]
MCKDHPAGAGRRHGTHRWRHPDVQGLGYATGAAYVGIVANAVGFAEPAEPADTADAALAVFAASLVFAAIGLAATGRFVFLGSKGRAG